MKEYGSDDFPYCYGPGWDEDPNEMDCVLPDGHDGDHRNEDGNEWPYSWTVEDDGTEPDASYSMTGASPYGD